MVMAARVPEDKHELALEVGRLGAWGLFAGVTIALGFWFRRRKRG